MVLIASVVEELNMQKTQTNEYTIDLVELGKTLLRNKWGILQIAFVCGVIAVLIALFFVTPQCEANASFYVNNSVAATQNSASSINNADLTAAHTLVNTYGVILKSRMVLTEIIDKAGLSYTPGELGRMITAHAINDTEVMSVVVKSSSPSEAERIANTIMEILPEKIADVVTGSSVKVVDYAVVPTSKSSPSVKNTLRSEYFWG